MKTLAPPRSTDVGLTGVQTSALPESGHRDMPPSPIAKLNGNGAAHPEPPPTLGFQLMRTAQIIPSSFNPRTHFDPVKLRELADSLKADGIIQPLVVRPWKKEFGDTFEIVCGERRYRAAKLAKLDSMPVIVKTLTDAQAVRIAGLENIQRDDLNALEEAHWFQTMLAKGGYAGGEKEKKIALAAEVGKSVRYVYQQLQLCTLIAPLQKSILAGELTASHGALLCRLQPKDQEAFISTFKQWGETPSVRRVGEWIERDLLLNLDASAWQKDDATLLPAAGACSVCSKRSGNCPELFAELKNKNICTDRACYQAKQQAFIDRAKREIVEAKCIKVAEPLHKKSGGVAAVCVSRPARVEDVVEISTDYSPIKKSVLGSPAWRVAKKGCAKPQPAIVVEGSGYGARNHAIGESLMVCLDDKCKSCRGSDDRGGSNTYAKQQAAERKKAEKEKRFRTALFIAIKNHADFADSRGPAGIALGKRLVRHMLDALDHDTRKRLFDVHGWQPAPGSYGQKNYDADAIAGVLDALSPPGVARMMEEIRLAGDLQVYNHSSSKPERLLAAAKELKINIGKLVKELEAPKLDVKALRGIAAKSKTGGGKRK